MNMQPLDLARRRRVRDRRFWNLAINGRLPQDRFQLDAPHTYLNPHAAGGNSFRRVSSRDSVSLSFHRFFHFFRLKHATWSAICSADRELLGMFLVFFSSHIFF